MKKLRRIFVVVMAIFLLAFFAGCSKSGTLAAPDADTFTIDEDNVLTWDPVDNARGYTIEIVNVDTRESITEKNIRKTSYDKLSELVEGNYEIRIMSVGGANYEIQSKWSAVRDFHKEYTTGCIYTLINNATEYEITRVGSASGTFVIEDVYRGKPVTQIKAQAFKGSKNIENVTIGKNVTYIGENAFYNCPNLVSVSIPDSVTYIGRAAFQLCAKLETVNIPEKLTEIDDFLFARCVALQSIELKEGITRIGECSFSECSSLTEINIPDSVTTIGESAFWNDTGLKKVTIGSGVETIDEYAFYQCQILSEVVFAENGNLTEIGKRAFSDCFELVEISLPAGLITLGQGVFYNDQKFEKITIPDSVEDVGLSAFSGTKLYLSQFESGFIYADNWLVAVNAAFQKTIVRIVANETEADAEKGWVALKSGTVGIAAQVFQGSEKLERVTVPASLLYIGANAFSSNKSLTDFRATYGKLKKIGTFSFSDCDILSTLVLNEGLESIGNYAFYKCPRVDNTSYGSLIPESVTSIGTYAFKDTALWNSPDEYGVIYAGNWVVGANVDSNVVLKKEVVGISNYAFYNAQSLNSISGLYNVKYLGKGAFCGCVSLITAQLPDTLEKIDDYTFYGCASLTSVSLPVSLKTVGRSAFYRCEKLTEFDLSDNIEESVEIEPYAFFMCTALNKVNLAEKVSSIGKYAFFDCSSLTEFDIPDSVTSVGERAFSYCSKLKTVTIGTGVTEISDYMFEECTSLKSVSFADANNVGSIGAYAFYNCSSLETMQFGESLTAIGDYAFYGTGFTSLALPASLVSIGTYAFKGCGNLKSVILPEGVQEVGAYAFFECPSAVVYFEGGAPYEEWNEYWNSSYRPVLYGCELSEDKSYVVSITVSEDTLLYGDAGGSFTPAREGYVFVGWTRTKGTSTVDFTAEEISKITEPTVLYPVWQTAS